MPEYQKHVFFCVNQKEEGKTCCAAGGNDALRAYAKKRLKDLNLEGLGKIRVNAAGCLGHCKLGPTCVVYPDGVWYHLETQDDVERVIQQHLIGGDVVTELLMVPV